MTIFEQIQSSLPVKIFLSHMHQSYEKVEGRSEQGVRMLRSCMVYLFHI